MYRDTLFDNRETINLIDLMFIYIYIIEYIIYNRNVNTTLPINDATLI